MHYPEFMFWDIPFCFIALLLYFQSFSSKQLPHLRQLTSSASEEEMVEHDTVQEYKRAITTIYNEGEDLVNTEKYKAAAVRLLIGKSWKHVYICGFIGVDKIVFLFIYATSPPIWILKLVFIDICLYQTSISFSYSWSKDRYSHFL